MVTVEQATQIILEHTRDFGTESISLAEAKGRLLKESLMADRDFPPFNRVTMDGIAIRYDEFAQGKRRFKITGMQAAGSPQNSLNEPNACMEVMTGAILPEGTDTVIRYEDLEITDSHATITVDALKFQQNVHHRSNDRPAGAEIVAPPKVISPAEVGLAATVGKTHLVVTQLPRVVIISTGDELVPVHVTPLPHQIRSSNVHTIKAALQSWKINADLLHLPDDKEKTIAGLEESLSNYDAIILSGGVSKGKFDYVPEALQDLNVEKLFHRVKQRPGKPFWFGRHENGTTVFALPGNPVSSFMCTNRYFLPWLKKSLGLRPLSTIFARLGSPIHFKPDLTYFAQVQLSYTNEGRLLALPNEGQGSGDLANLVDADAFIELPMGKDLYEAEEVYPVYGYRGL